MSDLNRRDIEIATIITERAGVLALAREYGRQLDGLIAAGKLSADDGTALKRRVSAFADGVATGLHVQGDAADVRAAMRAMLTEQRTV